MHCPLSRPLRLLLFMILAVAVAAPGAGAQGGQAVYTDSLQNGWQDYGWATRSYASPSPVHSGAQAISVTAGPYQALYVHHAAFDSTPYAALTFWINGGPVGGQTLQVQAELGGSAQAAYALPAPAANAWQQVTVPLAALGAAGKANLDGFWIQNTSGGTLPTFFVDDVALTGSNTPAPPATIQVDAAAGRHPISPLVYGVAYGSTSALLDLNCPLNRMGGNNTSRYNWQLNADNKDNDYFFESIGDADPTPGKRGDDFLSQSRAGGARAMLTIPMVGWVAKLGPNRAKLPSFSIAKYGPQQKSDPYDADAGNGLSAAGQPLTGNDPADADVPAGVAFQTGWINHLVGAWGAAAAGGLPYYLLDNEPSIWHSTHRDVHPQGEPMQEELTDILGYAGAVKAADPSALTVGPEEWGWSGYLYSGADQQYGAAHGYGSLPDRAAHGGMDYLPWLLQQLQQNNAATGKRLLDVFSVHFYPQGGEFSDDTSAATALLRNRSTRQLWDPNYVSESWINDKVQLIPRLKGWVSQYYPGTKTALTEYNWGAEADIGGATAQADIFGILGREGLDLATRWTTPDPSTPTYKAMKLYRNYDGSRSGFGDVSVSDAAPSPDSVSSFAATRSADGALTVMVIVKSLTGTAPVTVSLANFAAGPAAQAWQLTSANAITRLADVPVSGGALTATLPAQSVTLFVVPAQAPAATGPAIAAGAAAAPNPVTGATTGLTVLGADAGGEAALTYTWSATGPGPVAVSPNGTNAAKASTATFTAAGAYALTATVKNGAGLTAASTTTVTVTQTPTTVTITPASASVATGTTRQFSAAVADQFGAAITAAPSWAATGGTVTSTGLFTAGPAPGGPYAVTATSGSARGTSPVTVTASGLRWLMQDPGIGHVIGRPDADGWSANVTQDGVSFLQYGPYTTQVAPGQRVASWELMVDNNTYAGDGSPVLELQAYDYDKGTLLGTRDVQRLEWTSTFQYQTFSVPFTLPPADVGDRLEFRAFWFRKSYVRERSVAVQ